MACSITISERNDAPDEPWGSSGRRQSAAARNGLATVRYLLAAVALAAAAALSAPAWAQTRDLQGEQRTADDLAKNYSKQAMEQALQTKQRFDLYGLHFESDQSAINADGTSLLDDIATALKNFPDWGLRIVGHTDATADPQHNEALSLDRANAIKAALVERGVDPQRLLTAGAGEGRPVAANNTPEGRALNRRVELIRFTDSAEAKKLLKAMSDYLAAQTAISFDYNGTLEIVTNDEQELALESSGTVLLNRPDKIRTERSGGFVDFETLFDGKTLTLLGKNAKKYAQLDVPGTIEHLIDELRDKYDRPLPAADLLTSNAYAVLMEDVYDSKDLGSGVINGKECDFLAFRKDEVDFQVWIAQGDKPYPCKFVVTSRRVTGGPAYGVEFRNWKTGVDVAADDFMFKNTIGAEKIEVKELQDKMGDLPPNFSIGGGK